VNHVPDTVVLQSVIDAAALVVFVLAVAVLNEYVFLNGYPLHRFVALAGGIPLVPLLPRYVDWLAAQPPVLTWVAAVTVGTLAVNLCQRAVVVRLDRALVERQQRRQLRDLRALRLAGTEAVEPDAPAPNPDYFRVIDELDAAFGPVVASGDPLAQVAPRRNRHVA
jgi:hypothetical protein